MAKGEDRRMLFDIRGRRRHVIKVVYAVLALLMGASLFLVVGPFNLGEAVNQGGARSATEALEEQAERIEGRIQREPRNENLWLALTRARINAGNSLAETNPQTGVPESPPEALAHFQDATVAWNRYLEAAKEPNPAAASLVASAYFRLAETSQDIPKMRGYVTDAAEAQRLAAEKRPSVNALSTLAIYAYFDGDYAEGDRATAEVLDLVPKNQSKSVKKQLQEYRQRGKRFNKEVDRILKTEQGEGKEAFENALGGLSGGAGTLGAP